MSVTPLKDVIHNKNSIVIVGHIRPDGDCIGSALGLYNYITKNYKDKYVRVNLMHPLPVTFNFLNGWDKITWEKPDRQYDLAICVDCGAVDRIEEYTEYFDNAKSTFCIDHHITSNLHFADACYFDPHASSTCELVYDMLDPDLIDKETAKCLYSGIVTDTGCFKYKSTSKKTMQTAGALISKEIDFPAIVDRVFYEKTFQQNKIMGHVLETSMLICNGNCIVGVATKEDMDFYQVHSRHLEGIVAQLSNTRDVEVAMFLYELEPLCFKVSLRSKTTIDVAKIVSIYGGGGHKNAAGCTINGNVHDSINAISKYIEQQLLEQGFEDRC